MCESGKDASAVVCVAGMALLRGVGGTASGGRRLGRGVNISLKNGDWVVCPCYREPEVPFDTGPCHRAVRRLGALGVDRRWLWINLCTGDVVEVDERQSGEVVRTLKGQMSWLGEHVENSRAKAM